MRDRILVERLLIVMVLASACVAFSFSRKKKPEPAAPVIVEQPSAVSWGACKRSVHNRGLPPDWFLTEVSQWLKAAPESTFAKNSAHDVYTQVYNELGPWESDKHRRAVMGEVLRVLGGFESSWRHTVGLDTTNASSATSKCQEEAGIFQTSQNATYFGSDLKQMQKDLCKNYTQSNICLNFIACSKDSRGNVANREFIYGFTALLLRKTVNHHGPLKRKEINRWLSRDCVKEFEKRL
jgi:hypothetical protein